MFKKFVYIHIGAHTIYDILLNRFECVTGLIQKLDPVQKEIKPMVNTPAKISETHARRDLRAQIKIPKELYEYMTNDERMAILSISQQCSKILGDYFKIPKLGVVPESLIEKDNLAEVLLTNIKFQLPEQIEITMSE